MTTTRQIVITMDDAVESIDAADDKAKNKAEDKIVDTSRLEILVGSVLDGEGVAWSIVGIVLTGHERVRALNRDFLQHDFDTDVLSFLIDETEDGLEGEVYVDVETAAERHQEFNTTIREEIERYVVHGTLHLAGHNDATPEQRRAMQELETRYLEQ